MAGAQGLAVLTHGAGGGVEAADLQALAAQLESYGFSVALVEAPYRVAGRRAPQPVAALDRAFREVVAVLRGSGALVTGGRSLGARVACRTAADLGARAVIALAFPLHPPGRPERSRAGELAGAGVPVVVVQGERDPFGAPGELPPVSKLLAAPGADHALRQLDPALLREAACFAAEQL